MIYRSNLTCFDLTPHFKRLVSRPMPHSFGHDVPSDWGDKGVDDPVFGLYKNCGLWTHDEAAILFNVAKSMPGFWLDIGAHTGWTTAHIYAGLKASGKPGAKVVPVDPMFAVAEFEARFYENNPDFRAGACAPRTSAEYFRRHLDMGDDFTGVCIDGDHEPGEPLADAQNAATCLQSTGVIILHDFVGKPVRDAAVWLMMNGFKCRVYFTPHMVALCWRGEFVPPNHDPDPGLPDLKARCADFPFERCV